MKSCLIRQTCFQQSEPFDWSLAISQSQISINGKWFVGYLISTVPLQILMEHLSSRCWQIVLAERMGPHGSFVFHLQNLDSLIIAVIQCKAEADFTFSESAIKAI